MRKIKSGLLMSLDGVVNADDDWQYAYFDDELFERITDAWESSDTAVMGRRSFEGYQALRSEHPDSPMLAFLDRVDRYVASTTITATDWAGTTVLRRDVHDHLAGLRRRDGADILIAGSPTLVRGLLAHGLLDELTITLMPVLVGRGQRLFPEAAQGLERLPLTLTDSTTLSSGVLELRYGPTSAELTTRP